MLLLAFLGSWGVIFVLATIGMVDCIFRRVGLHPSRFHFRAWGTAVLFSVDGAEWNENVTVFCLLLYVIILVPLKNNSNVKKRLQWGLNNLRLGQRAPKLGHLNSSLLQPTSATQLLSKLLWRRRDKSWPLFRTFNTLSSELTTRTSIATNSLQKFVTMAESSNASEIRNRTSSAVRGHHLYKEIWDPFIHDTFSTKHERRNSHNRYAMTVIPDDMKRKRVCRFLRFAAS